ncbi:hypothetical protein [Rubrivivax gelatinosus]|uniref:hypothetical protein n=1 Tax=Rubrivivax gelatinosus TaxID=28068 RepID=UPI00187221FE|nr:hypothetical protein [Rubrivivax gelatinosus]MBG6083188.1 hypothetical protein [Rubrivivax gelatinosus]
MKTDETVEAHVGRIRYLAHSGWSDAIELDVGCPVLGYAGPAWPCVDGNHRLSAAILRGDATILVDVSGQVDHAARLLGVPEKLILGERLPADLPACPTTQTAADSSTR